MELFLKYILIRTVTINCFVHLIIGLISTRYNFVFLVPFVRVLYEVDASPSSGQPGVS